MGEAGQAAGGVLLLAENPNKIRARSDKWSKENIIGGASSKNINLLRYAHDLLLADRSNDLVELSDAWKALEGYFGVAKKKGMFWGEEFSCIYWRWICIPIYIAGAVAQKRNNVDIVQQVDQWLQDFITLNALAALPATHYKGSEHSSAKGKNIFGMPCAFIMGARSWVMNKGDDEHRDFDDSMSWVDATSHAPWLAWVLGRVGINELTGGDGWVRKVTQGVYKTYKPRAVLDSNTALELNVAINTGNYPSNVINSMVYGPMKPMVVGRTTMGTWCVGERSYSEGSTSFMHVKVLPISTLAYRVYGVAHPLKRTNKDPATAIVSSTYRKCTITADDGTVFDWDMLEEREGTLTVPLLDGGINWVVRVAAGRKPERLDAQNGQLPPPNDNGGWCDWYKRIF